LRIEAAERQPKEELDEEQLVRELRPLIEEGGKILTEANGIIRGLDPDGRIQANAKHKSATREASPEEFHLADLLKELTGTVTKTIEDAKKKIGAQPALGSALRAAVPNHRGRGFAAHGRARDSRQAGE
jgi:hypothetical protein